MMVIGGGGIPQNGPENDQTRKEKEKKMASEKAEAMVDDGFVTVSDGQAEQETKIVIDTLGDSFTGKYLGMRDIPTANGSYQQARFELDGDIYFVNANYSLRDGLSKVRTGTVTRFTWTDELDTGQEMPMRIFKVETKRR
jgi:hypothetical protein